MSLHLLLFCLMIVVAHAGVAQEQTSLKPPPKLDQVYVDNGVGAGLTNVGGFNYSLAMIAGGSSGWGGAFRLRVADFPSVNEPSDYSPGFCFFGSCEPRDQITSLALTGNKLITFGDGPFSLAVEAGPAVVFSNQRTFTPNSHGGFVGPSYIVSAKKETGLGGSGRVSAHIRFAPFLGLAIGAGGVLNTYRNTLSFDIALLAGRLHLPVSR